MRQIQGLTRGPDGARYGSYFDTNSNTDGRILRIRRDGTLQTFVAPGSGGLYSPAGLVFGPDGHLYVLNNLGNVLRFNGTTGAFMNVFAAGLSVPQDLAFGPDGHRYVTNGLGDSVSRFDGTSGASLGLFVLGGAYGLDAPIGLTFGRSEDFYVASFPGNTIFRFDGISGALVSTFNLPYQDGQDTLLDLAFGPDQNLYASMRLAAGGTSILRHRQHPRRLREPRLTAQFQHGHAVRRPGLLVTPGRRGPSQPMLCAAVGPGTLHTRPSRSRPCWFCWLTPTAVVRTIRRPCWRFWPVATLRVFRPAAGWRRQPTIRWPSATLPPAAIPIRIWRTGAKPAALLGCSGSSLEHGHNLGHTF